MTSSLSPSCWKSAPIVARLFAAYHGFRDDYLGCIPPHILCKIKGSFHHLDFLRPHCPPLSPSSTAPLDDPTYKALIKVLKAHPSRPQQEVYKIFLDIVHPTSLPHLSIPGPIDGSFNIFHAPFPLPPFCEPLTLSPGACLLTLPSLFSGPFAMPGLLGLDFTRRARMFGSVFSVDLGRIASPYYCLPMPPSPLTCCSESGIKGAGHLL